MSYIQSFPSSVAHTLHWSLSDVNDATAKLRSELQGHIPDVHLNLQGHQNPPLGAIDPDDLP